MRSEQVRPTGPADPVRGWGEAAKDTSDTNGRVTATDPVNTAVPDLQQEFTQA